MMGILERILGGNVLYYPGCMTKFLLKDVEKNYERILRSCGIDFIKLKDLEVCCGSPVKNAGYVKVFGRLVRKNFQVFKEHSVKKIITNCPACFHVISQEYPKFVKGWDIEVEHATVTIWKAMDEGKLKFKKSRKIRVTYHDPCHLGRYSGIYDEPRNILKALGYEIVEMEFSHENSFCCGGGGGVRANYPELSKSISLERIRQAKKTGVKVLVTACPLCYACLKDVSRGKVKVLEISELLK
ncbi:MAG TPA: (Fe-S)-binding protein [Thermoplasmata archaeon]|nr:(Fe-S)-binding protein [Thermoplasmata archaeon]